MKRTAISTYFFGAAILTMTACSDTEVEIEDEALERAVLAETGVENLSDITQEQRDNVTVLESSEPVTTMDGIEQFAQLERIILPDSELEDVRAVTELDQLTYLETGALKVDPEIEETLYDPLQSLEEEEIEIVTGSAVLPEIEHDGPSRGIFHEVHFEDRTLYLFGSIHVGLEEFYPLRSEVETAFEESEQLALEVDITDPETITAVESLTMEAFGGSDADLSEQMDDELYEELTDILQGMGMPEMMINSAEPWVLNLMLTNYLMLSTDFEEEYGVESHFLTQAEERNLPLIELESVEDQMSALQETPYEEQLAGLENVLQDMDAQEEQLLHLSRVWQAGDKEILRFYRSLDDEAEALALDERDEQMAARIAEMMQEDSYTTTFAVVGALHTAGDNSIPALLEQEDGFEVNLID